MSLLFWTILNLVLIAFFLWTLFLGGDRYTMQSPRLQRVLGFRGQPEVRTLRFFAWLGFFFVIVMFTLGAVFHEVRDFFVNFWQR